MAVIFVLSGMSKPPAPVSVNDKIKHFVGYAVLGAVTMRATAGGTLGGLTAGAALAAWAIATLYGVSDEYHQSFVPGRTADPADTLADAAGAAVSIAALWASGIIARSRQSSGAATRRR
jgi:VanZ family protein